MLAIWNFQRFEDWEAKSRLFRLMKGDNGFPPRRSIDDIRRNLAEKKTSVETVMPYLNDGADFMLVCAIMGHTRRFWSPQSGKGSQDTSLDLHKTLWGIFTNRANEMEKRWEE